MKGIGKVYVVTAYNTMKTQTITLENKTIEIKKLPIGKYGELLKGITELPKHIKNIDQLTTDQIIEQLPFYLSIALPDVAKIVVTATDNQITVDEFNMLGLDEVTNIIVAIYEANNYANVISTIKKVLARPIIKT